MCCIRCSPPSSLLGVLPFYTILKLSHLINTKVKIFISTHLTLLLILPWLSKQENWMFNLVLSERLRQPCNLKVYLNFYCVCVMELEMASCYRMERLVIVHASIWFCCRLHSNVNRCCVLSAESGLLGGTLLTL